MALTRDFKKTVVDRVNRDPAFARALLAEANTLFAAGDAETARLILRDLVNATIGFEGLAKAIPTPVKSLHRMLSQSGNPSMNNIAAIFAVMSNHLHVEIESNVIEYARKKTALAKSRQRTSAM